MRDKAKIAAYVCLGFGLALAAVRAGAQDRAIVIPASAKMETQLSRSAAYRLDFEVIESEDGKKINARQYVMHLMPGYVAQHDLKIGTRIPVEAKQGDVHYLDIGTNIWARVAESEDGLQLDARADLSRLADNPGVRTMPAVEQFQIAGSTLAVLGKPMVLGIVDDPGAKRQFQLAVTVTRLR